MKITEITAEKKENKIQRLAAYCRVSSDSADQLHSFAAQLRYYSNYEKQHPEFELVGIYADEGLSGTSMKKRAEMNRLIQDCEQGKIDRVIVKSISRFARNTHDLLQTLRLLKSYGVTVFFEEQSIDTSQLNSEMFLTFPGMIAQQESESISGNMRWSYKKRMESGEFNCCAPAYGFDLINGELVINETEAAVVRRIFGMYLQGVGKQRIADALNNECVPKKHGEKKWNTTMITYILGNERYIGDALLQKKYTTDTLPFRLIPNKGERPQYYVENAGPAMIHCSNTDETITLESYRIENEIRHMIDGRQLNKSEIRRKLIEATAIHYANLNTKKYEIQRLKYILKNQNRPNGFPLELFNLAAETISFDEDKQVVLTLINGQTIRKEHAYAAS